LPGGFQLPLKNNAFHGVRDFFRHGLWRPLAGVGRAGRG
jgi:hypothetical protein